MIKKGISLILALCLFLTGSSFASAAFKDAGREHWAVDEITYLTGKKVISGFNDGSFRPQASVTRLQAMILMARALNLDLSNRPDPGFKDLSKMNNGYAYAAAVMDEGLFPKSTYLKPNEPMSRELMARMIVPGFKLKSTKQAGFKDVSSSYWASPYISALAEHNITLGYPDGTFRPSATLTRAQFSVFLAKAMNDDYKTFTFSNPEYRFSIELPNYISSKAVYEDGVGSATADIFSVSFFYDNPSYIGYEPFAGAIHIIPSSLWHGYYDSAPFYLIKKANGYYYCYQGQSEDPYYPYNSNTRESRAFTQIHDRLEKAIKNIKVY